MENWLKINNFKFAKLKYSLINIKFTLFKLKIKNFFFKIDEPRSQYIQQDQYYKV